MICPRCDSHTVQLLVKAPVDNAWEIYKCNTCDFSWRSTESDDIINPEQYDRRFKIKPEKIQELDTIPPIPKLVK